MPSARKSIPTPWSSGTTPGGIGLRERSARPSAGSWRRGAWQRCLRTGRLRPLPNPVRSLGDVLYIANMLSGGHFEWLMQDQDSGPDHLIPLEQKYAHLLPDIEALADEMRGSFG